MSSFYAISSNFMKKTIPLYDALSSWTSISIIRTSLLQTFDSISFKKISPAHDKQNFVHASAQMMTTGSQELPESSPPEVPTAPPFHKPGLPRRPNVPDFDPIPPENPADPPPISPGPNPEFPGPPDPLPPKPEAPQPPGQPEVFPPHGPDVIPPKPPEPGFPHPTQPDIPPPFTM